MYTCLQMYLKTFRSILIPNIIMKSSVANDTFCNQYDLEYGGNYSDAESSDEPESNDSVTES